METSNLLQYSSNMLKILLRGVDMVRKEEQAYQESRTDMLNGEDLSPSFELRQRAAIFIHEANIEDCKLLEVALRTNLQRVENEEKLLQQ